MNVQQILNLYNNDLIEKYNKNIKIIKKSDSFLMKLISYLFFYNKNFMSRFTTTIGNKVYVPDHFYNENQKLRSLRIFSHEGIHIKQQHKQSNILHAILYLFPQILILLSFLAIPFSNLWLLCLFFILPFPAPFRYKKELEAYRVGILWNKTLFPNNVDRNNKYKKFIISTLSRSSYYYTWPFPKKIKKDLEKNYWQFEKEYLEIKQWILKNSHYF